jgi:hypothetical protein
MLHPSRVAYAFILVELPIVASYHTRPQMKKQKPVFS